LTRGTATIQQDEGIRLPGDDHNLAQVAQAAQPLAPLGSIRFDRDVGQVAAHPGQLGIAVQGQIVGLE